MLVILLGVTILSMILFVKCSFLYFSKSWLGEKILNSPMFYWPSLKIKQNERNLSPYLRTEVNCGRSTVFMERSDRWFCRLERAGFRQNHDRDVCSIFSRMLQITSRKSMQKVRNDIRGLFQYTGNCCRKSWLKTTERVRRNSRNALKKIFLKPLRFNAKADSLNIHRKLWIINMTKF